MKKRIAPILTIGIFVILIGSIAYAADRRKNSKQVNQPIDPIQEEESLRTELLEAVDVHDKKVPIAAAIGKVSGGKAGKSSDKAKSGK